MPLPDLASVCVQIQVPPQNLSVTFPGGAEMSVQLAEAGIPDLMQLAKQMMAQANGALMPLVPVFNIIDTVLALFQTVKAIPDAIGSLNPSKIISSLPDLVKKASKLLKLVPQLSVPLMVVGLIDVLLAYLEGLRLQLHALIATQVRLAKASERAAALGSAQLQVVVDCANGNVAAQMKNLGESAAPVNRLIRLLNLFMELVGLPTLPDISDLGQDAQAALVPLDALVNALKQIRSAIPL